MFDTGKKKWVSVEGDYSGILDQKGCQHFGMDNSFLYVKSEGYDQPLSIFIQESNLNRRAQVYVKDTEFKYSYN